MELYNKLISEDQETWTSFMFNVEDLKKIKLLQDDLVSQLLLAGARFLGLGWSPERASKRLLELSGFFLVKPNFET